MPVFYTGTIQGTVTIVKRSFYREFKSYQAFSSPSLYRAAGICEPNIPSLFRAPASLEIGLHNPSSLANPILGYYLLGISVGKDFGGLYVSSSG